MSILGIIRLDKNISTGLVFKVLLPTVPGEKEHALHVLVNGSIKPHTHSDADGISEGYREWNPETGETSEWEVVGAGMSQKSHEVKFKKGIRFIEGSKRGYGIGNWPEIMLKFPFLEKFLCAIADGDLVYQEQEGCYVDNDGNKYDQYTGRRI